MSLSVSLRAEIGALPLAVDFETPAGVTALFGPSGAGKTTIVDMIAGLRRPDSGQIELDGAVLFDSASGVDLAPRLRRVGYVFQEGRLFPHLNVRNNLRFGAWFAPKGATGPDFDTVVELLGLEALLGRSPAKLSGGERQRVALGRALLARPRLLLMDEPLAALDTARKSEILPFIERLRDETGLPIVLVSHSRAETIRLATTVVGVEHGKSTLVAPPAAFFGLDPEAGQGPTATLPARLIAPPGAGGRALLACAGGKLSLEGPAAAGLTGVASGQGLALRFAARDVILSAGGAIASRNVLTGTVARIDAHSPDDPAAENSGWAAGESLVSVALPTDQTLYALAPEAALSRAEIAPGTEVQAVITRMALAPRS